MMPTDLTTFQALLDHQAKPGVRAGDWTQIAYREVRHPVCDMRMLQIDSHHVGFVFSRAGRLLGIYNWKE